MIVCKIFGDDISNLTPQERKDRCGHCLEGNENHCSHTEIVKEEMQIEECKYKIVIPSYKRYGTIKSKTLSYLDKCNIPHSSIYVFVADQFEYEMYKVELPKDINIVNGVLTLHKQRNFIRNYFNDGELLVSIDDDLDYLCKNVDGKLVEYYDLIGLISMAEYLMDKHKTKLFGIYPVNNHFFMSDTIDHSLQLVIGGFHISINDKSPELDLEFEEKEDYERCIKNFIKFKSIVRYNNLCAKINFYTLNGGMKNSDRMQNQHKAVEELLKRYPPYCKINKTKSEFPEIKLVKEPKSEQSSIDSLFGSL